MISITQRLQTDLGRSFGVTTTSQPVNGYSAFSKPQKPFNQKDTLLKFVNNPPYRD